MESNEESKVALDRSAPDVLDPSINVAEADERKVMPAIVDEDAPTEEEMQQARQEKQEMYQEENDEKSGITRSEMDKGQEAQLSPEAQKSLKESQERAKAQAQQAQAEQAQQQQQAQQQTQAKPQEKQGLVDKVLHRK